MKTFKFIDSISSCILIVVFIFSCKCCSPIFGQNSGDYRSFGNGAWNSPETWEFYNGYEWQPASNYPGQLPGDGDVFIINAHIVTLTTNVPNPFNGLIVTGIDETYRSSLKLPGSTTLLLPVSSILLTNFGQIFWSWTETSLYIPEGASILINDGGMLTANPCTNIQRLYIGDIPYAACQGPGNVQYLFRDLNEHGGSLNVTANSNSPVCHEEILSLAATPTGPGAKTYNWQGIGPDGYTFGPVTGQNQSIEGIEAGTYTFTVTISDAYNNSKTDSHTAIVIDLPTASISGDAVICEGGNAELTFYFTGESPWSFTFTDGVTPVTIGEISSSSCIVPVTPTTTTTYSLVSCSDINCEVTPTGENATITVEPMHSEVNLTIFLEGFFNTATGHMNKCHDFCQVSQGIIYKYEGDIVDLITIELHDPELYGSIVYKASNIPLHQNGLVTFCLPESLAGSYYLTIRHRNHLETVSAEPIDFTYGIVSYDFSSSATKAYGSNLCELLPGIFGIFAGDVNQDGVINLSDREAINDHYLTTMYGYQCTDINGDAVINLSDREIVNDAYLKTVQVKVPD
jgi:hypothetical protein